MTSFATGARDSGIQHDEGQDSRAEALNPQPVSPDAIDQDQGGVIPCPATEKPAP